MGQIKIIRLVLQYKSFGITPVQVLTKIEISIFQCRAHGSYKFVSFHVTILFIDYVWLEHVSLSCGLYATTNYAISKSTEEQDYCKANFSTHRTTKKVYIRLAAYKTFGSRCGSTIH
jgi:hypothetical protein